MNICLRRTSKRPASRSNSGEPTAAIPAATQQTHESTSAALCSSSTLPSASPGPAGSASRRSLPAMPHGLSSAAPVTGIVVGNGEPKPRAPVVGRRLDGCPALLERGVGRQALGSPARPARQVVDRQASLSLQLAGHLLCLDAELDLPPQHPCADHRQDDDGKSEKHRRRRSLIDEQNPAPPDENEVGRNQRAERQRDPASGHNSSSCSSPTVRPGSAATLRTPNSTPGMNEIRSNESCRMVSCSPGPPSSTS